jgi:hypothetical protein
MNIEKVKENAEKFNLNYKRMSDVDYLKACSQAANDRDDLLNYIDQLEEKLKWKNADEIEPPLEKPIMIKYDNNTVRIFTLFKGFDNRLYYTIGKNDCCYLGLNCEWREI